MRPKFFNVLNPRTLRPTTPRGGSAGPQAPGAWPPRAPLPAPRRRLSSRWKPARLRGRRRRGSVLFPSLSPSPSCFSGWQCVDGGGCASRRSAVDGQIHHAGPGSAPLAIGSGPPKAPCVRVRRCGWTRCRRRHNPASASPAACARRASLKLCASAAGLGAVADSPYRLGHSALPHGPGLARGRACLRLAPVVKDPLTFRGSIGGMRVCNGQG